MSHGRGHVVYYKVIACKHENVHIKCARVHCQYYGTDTLINRS